MVHMYHQRKEQKKKSELLRRQFYRFGWGDWQNPACSPLPYITYDLFYLTYCIAHVQLGHPPSPPGNRFFFIQQGRVTCFQRKNDKLDTVFFGHIQICSWSPVNKVQVKYLQCRMGRATAELKKSERDGKRDTWKRLVEEIEIDMGSGGPERGKKESDTKKIRFAKHNAIPFEKYE